MSKPNIEYEICLSGKIKISDLENLEILDAIEKKIINHSSKYFDDDNLYLLNNGLGLRLRYENSHWVQTLKYERSDQSRLEWDFRLTENDINKTPHLNEFALPNNKALEEDGCFLEKDLQNIAKTFEEKFSVEIKRTLWLINYHESKIEISYDCGFIRTSKGREKISEIELELIKGKSYVLWILAKDLLRALPGLSFEYRSKAFRGFLLNGLKWQKFKPLNYSKILDKNYNFEQALKEILQKKNKEFSFFISIKDKKNEKKITLYLIKVIINLKYILHFLITSKICKSKITESKLKSLRSRCSAMENKLKVENNNFNTISFFQETQFLIADIGLFANNTNSLLFKNDVYNSIKKFFIKLEESIDRRKNLINKKGGYKLIKYNYDFFLTLKISEKIIKKNHQLDQSVYK